MVIPMNNGRAIITVPIHTPYPKATINTQSNAQTNMQRNESNLPDWAVWGVVLILLIVFVMCY